MLRRLVRMPGLCSAALLLALLPARGGAANPEIPPGRAPASPTPAVEAADLDLVRRLNGVFVRVADTVSPSVVVIRVRPKMAGGADFDHGRILEMLPEAMRKEMRERIEQERKKPRPRLPEGLMPEQGSGLVLREDGYILTNGHVVENAEKIEVRLKDGRRFPAEVKGADPEADVAVLKVDATGLPVARFGDSSKVRVGEFAIAIGAPYELAYSVTFGHISAKGRRLVEDVSMMDQDFLQTDASINPGNSGGPLVNIEGEVIGINTMIRGLNTGIGFAVPMDLAREVADQLIEKGRFARAWLGVAIESAADRIEATGAVLPVKEGVIVTHVLREGPSWGSELAAQDIIVGVDGDPVRDVGDLKHYVSRKKVGRPVALDVYRGENKLTVKVSPGELPAERLMAGRTPHPMPPAVVEPQPAAEPDSKSIVGLGVKVGILDQESASKVGLEKDQGVLVVEVQSGGPADGREIHVGDVITRVNRRSVKSPKEFEAAAKDVDLRRGVAVTVYGAGGKRRSAVLKK